MRVQSTRSCLLVCRPSRSFCFMGSGTLSLKKVRPSSRNASSSLLRLRSIGVSCEWLLVNDFEQAGGAHATADAHGDDSILRLAAAAFDQRVAGQARAGHAVGM